MKTKVTMSYNFVNDEGVPTHSPVSRSLAIPTHQTINLKKICDNHCSLHSDYGRNNNYIMARRPAHGAVLPGIITNTEFALPHNIFQYEPKICRSSNFKSIGKCVPLTSSAIRTLV